MTEGARVRLRAEDLEDLAVLSGLVQDALVPPGDMAWLPDEGRFVLALNRFRWEDATGGRPYSRTHAALIFDHVSAVQRRGMEAGDRDRVYALLAIAYDADSARVVLTFSGEAAIRLTVDRLAAGLEDLGEPWPTQWKPEHDPDSPG
jgi:hypothetical protein